jgi:putative addiction module CopG family antidote
MTSLNISLPETMRAWVEDKVAKGGYGTASELIRELIRDAQRRDPPVTGGNEIGADVEDAEKRNSTCGDLLRFAGTWEGDDLEDCLRLVYQTRSEVDF